MDLDSPVDHVVQHLGAEELDQGDLFAGGSRPLGVDDPCGVQRHEARGLHLSGGVGDPVLHRLVAGQLLAEGFALQRPLAEHVEGAARLAEPAHAVVDAPWPEPSLCDQEPLAAFADEVVFRHANVLVQDFGVAVSEPLVLSGHRRDVPYLLEPWRVRRHDDHRSALIRAGFRIGDDHRDQEVRDHSVGREPLVSIDHPLVAFQHRGG